MSGMTLSEGQNVYTLPKQQVSSHKHDLLHLKTIHALNWLCFYMF